MSKSDGFLSKLPCCKNKKDDKEEKEVKRVSMAKLFRFANKLDYLLIVIGTIASLVTGACLPCMTIVFGGMTNTFKDFSFAQGGNSTLNLEAKNLFWETMKKNTYYFIIIGAVVAVTGYIQVVCWLTVSYRQSFKIRTNLFQAILKQEIGWFDTMDVGQLSTRLSDDVNKIREGIGDKMSTFFQWISTFLVGIIIGFVKGPKLAAVVIAISPLIAISGGIMTYMITTATSKELTAYAKAGSVAEEVFAAIRTVVAFSGQEKAIEKYTKNLDKAKAFGIKKGVLGGLGMGFALMIIFCSYALAFWYGGKLIRNGEMDLGDVLNVFFAVVVGAFALGNSGPSLQSIGTARGAAFSLWEIIDRKSLIDSSSNEGVTLKSLTGKIEFKDVYFTYPSRKESQILKGLSMKLKEGLTVAVVGESGCGKSTLIQLVERFYDPDNGSVLIDGTEIKQMNIKWLRRQIGVVNQEPVLFATTIAINISYGLEGATQTQIEEAAKKANAHDFICSLPQKYDTMVGERGAHMSGGQKQRIAIARSLMNNPKIILLDEATSALDNESESMVQAALDKARTGRTTIIVAHRLSTIKNADIIFGIKDGVVHESGSHDELMDMKGIYYSLVTSQKVGDYDENHKTKKVEEDSLPKYKEVEFQRNSSMRRSSKRSIPKININEDNDDKEVTKEVSMTRLMAYNKPEWYYLVIGSIASLIHGAIQPAFAILFAKFIGTFGVNVSPAQWEKNIAIIAGLFAVIGVVAFLSLLLLSTMFSIAGENLTKRMRTLLFKHILKQNMEFFDDHNNSVGALTTRLATDASAIQGGTGSRLGMLFQSLSSIGVGIIIGFIYSWKMTLLVLGCLPLLVMGIMLEMKMAKGFSGKNKSALEEAGKVATEAISNIRTVVYLCKEEMFAKKYYDHLYGPYKQNLCKAHVSGLTYSISQSLIYFCYAAIFILGAHLNRINDLDYESMFIVFGAIIFGAMAMGQASQFAPDYAKVKISLARVFELLDSKPSIDIYSNAGIKPAKIDGSVNFVDVSFAYPTRETAKVLNKFNMRVDPGMSVALVGFSGSGKSTTIQLLERFYDCLGGSILLDQYNIKSVNVMWLRSQLGLVQQEPMLFDCSIRENIAYGDNSREVSMEEIIESAQKANIAEFIKTLPEGYETNVGDKGVQLSGGQKQRVAIARALVRNPKILLLDEATSALDTESEKVVQEALQKAQVGRTSLVIAHRLSTIQNSDCIFVCNGGIIAEYGTHSELLKQQGIYFNLTKTQPQ